MTALKWVMTGAGSPCASDLWEGEADNYHSLLGTYLHSGRLPGWTEFSFYCRIGSVLMPVKKNKQSKLHFSLALPLSCKFWKIQGEALDMFEFSCSLWNSGLITQTVYDGKLVTVTAITLLKVLEHSVDGLTFYLFIHSFIKWK